MPILLLLLFAIYSTASNEKNIFVTFNIPDFVVHIDIYFHTHMARVARGILFLFLSRLLCFFLICCCCLLNVAFSRDNEKYSEWVYVRRANRRCDCYHASGRGGANEIVSSRNLALTGSSKQSDFVMIAFERGNSNNSALFTVGIPALSARAVLSGLIFIVEKYLTRHSNICPEPQQRECRHFRASDRIIFRRSRGNKIINLKASSSSIDGLGLLGRETVLRHINMKLFYRHIIRLQPDRCW